MSQDILRNFWLVDDLAWAAASTRRGRCSSRSSAPRATWGCWRRRSSHGAGRCWATTLGASRTWGLSAALALFVAACAPAASSEPPGTPRPAGAAPAAGAGTPGDPAEWDALVEAARQEGKVVVYSVPNVEMRQRLPVAFRERFGVDLDFVGMDTPEAAERALIEDRAGNLTIDLLSGGQESLVSVLHPAGMLAPIRPLLVHPEVRDAAVWLKGQPWLLDDAGTILRVIDLVVPIGAVNGDVIAPGEIASSRDLLDPRWNGKMAGYDATIGGPGLNTAAYLMQLLGEDYVLQLYKGQGVQFSRDRRQLADWLARGQYPVVIALSVSEVDKLRKDGFNVRFLALADVVPPEGPASGLFVLLKRAPHPKAAQLLLNWLMTREGMQLYTELEGAPGTRTDLDTSKLVQESVPRPGQQYFDTADWDYLVNQRARSFNRLRELMGR